MTTLHFPTTRHTAAAALIVLCLFLAGVQTAGAHAQLSASTPLSGSALSAMPDQVGLEFTEPVVPASVSLRLERDDGTVIPLAQPVIDADGHRVRAAIDQSQAEQGTFQMTWSVQSAADGHDSAGLIAFTVGTGRAPPAVESAGSDRDPWWQIAARTIWLLAMATIAAGIITSLLR